MTQIQLDRAVAAVTGESRRVIRELGFSLADPWDVCFDPEPGDQALADQAKFLDWDAVDAERHAELAIF